MIIDTLMVIWSLMRRARFVKVFSLILMTGICVLLVLFSIGLPLLSRQSSLDSHALMRQVANKYTATILTTPVTATVVVTMTPVASSMLSVPVTFVPTPMVTPSASGAFDVPCVPLSTPVPPPGRQQVLVSSPVVHSLPSPTVTLSVPSPVVSVTPALTVTSIPVSDPTVIPTVKDASSSETPGLVISPTVTAVATATSGVATVTPTVLAGITPAVTVVPGDSSRSVIGEMEQKTSTSPGTKVSVHVVSANVHRVVHHRSSAHALHVLRKRPRQHLSGTRSQEPPGPVLHCLS
jgi:hypothetical protein